jgi:hypothetical protein
VGGRGRIRRRRRKKRRRRRRGNDPIPGVGGIELIVVSMFGG